MTALPATTENREFTMTAPNVLAHVFKTLPAAASATFLALFPIVNPSGGVPLFFSLTSNFSAGERNRTALKTGIYVTVVLIFFMFLGRFVLSFFGISLPVLMIAGGLIVANTAWGMVTASSRITGGGEPGSEHKRRYLAYAYGNPYPLGSRLDRSRDGSGSRCRFQGRLSGDGDCDSGYRTSGVPVSSSRRSAGRAYGAVRHRSRQPHLRVLHPGYCGAVGMGRRG